MVFPLESCSEQKKQRTNGGSHNKLVLDDILCSAFEQFWSLPSKSAP